MRRPSTAASVGSPAEIQDFVFSGLNRFGCAVAPNDDDSWRNVVSSPALQTASLGEVIEKATFDAERALDDPDMTPLDLRHPLVRQLIEEVKQGAFRPGEHYDRATAIVTPDVEEVTALFHLLARYVVNTQPASIVEELLPMAMPVYGGGPLDVEAARRLFCVTPSPRNLTEVEAREALADVLAIEGLDELIEQAVERRRQELAAERHSLRRQMEAQEGGQAVEWLAGIDDVAPGSFDLLTLTVFYPA